MQTLVSYQMSKTILKHISIQKKKIIIKFISLKSLCWLVTDPPSRIDIQIAEIKEDMWRALMKYSLQSH